MDWHALFEPEETVGRLWNAVVGERATLPRFPEAAVPFAAVQRALGVTHRGLGGAAAIEIKAADEVVSHHRLSLRQRLARDDERVTLARFTGEALLLPAEIALLPDPALNRGLYRWLAGWAVIAAETPKRLPRDPFAADVARLRRAVAATTEVERRFPGLAALGRDLAAALLVQRPRRALPDVEGNVEAVIRHLLGDPEPERDPHGILAAVRDVSIPLKRFVASPKYRPALPVALWGEVEPTTAVAAKNRDGEDGETKSEAGRDESRKTRRAKRRESDQVEKPDALFIHRFDKILSWAEFLNLHRDVEDDEEEQAKKAADDHDEIGLASIRKKASTRLAFDLDLAPEEVAGDRLAGRFTYPEWDCRRSAYLPAHTVVLAGPAEPVAEGTWRLDAAARRRIREVKRRFEALTAGRVRHRAQVDGAELDVDAVVRAAADLRACGEGSDRVFEQVRTTARDLAVTVLVDTSRSTEAYADDRPVIEVEKEALIAFAEGLGALGDAHELLAFSSLKRTRVRVETLKAFDEPYGATVRARIGGLRPGHYTRLGAAIRHATVGLAKRPNRRRLLIVLTDGKPNDLDHYEGRFGVEDSRKAIEEARAAGCAVFGITVDKEARAYVPRLFGANGFAVIGRPGKLVEALPVLYRHIVGT
ncbi:MAG: VWA domain-containing protein [Hyphomicrobiales bacterium]|nr:VWA domain-containing protein [Hyphomicrobiales bacterium]